MIDDRGLPWRDRLTAVLDAAGELRPSIVELALGGLDGSEALVSDARRINGGDAHGELIGEAAHKLANTCAALRLSEELERARLVEQHARAGRVEDAIAEWERLKPQLEQIRAYLRGALRVS